MMTILMMRIPVILPRTIEDDENGNEKEGDEKELLPVAATPRSGEGIVATNPISKRIDRENERNAAAGRKRCPPEAKKHHRREKPTIAIGKRANRTQIRTCYYLGKKIAGAPTHF